MVIPHYSFIHGILYNRTGNHYGLCAQCSQCINHFMIVFLGDAVCFIGGSRQITGFRVIGHNIICHGDQLSHQFHRFFRHAIVQLSIIAHDGICEYSDAFSCILDAELRDHLRLLF